MVLWNNKVMQDVLISTTGIGLGVSIGDEMEKEEQERILNSISNASYHFMVLIPGNLFITTPL